MPGTVIYRNSARASSVSVEWQRSASEQEVYIFVPISNECLGSDGFLLGIYGDGSLHVLLLNFAVAFTQ